jgi:hypothetical protein
MERLESLIKEILSQPKKKDCGCGCNTCGDKAPILTEGKFKSLISEGLQHHIDKKISLFESVYRIGSEKHLELIREARALWIRGIIEVSDDDKGLLETHLGHFGLYEGVEVPLDLPMVNEIEMPSQEEVDKFFSITQNEIHYLNSKPVMGQKGDRVRSEIEPWDEYDLSNWNVLVRKAKAQGKLNEEVDEEKDRANEIMRDLFGLDFEFDYTYKPEGDRIIIGAEGYNPDGTLFDMKDVHKEKIIRTFRDKMPNAVVKPNMGGGITVFLKESLNEAHKLFNQTNLSPAEYQKAKTLKGWKERKDDYIWNPDKDLWAKKSSLDEVDRYSGFDRNPEDPDSVPFEPKGSVAQFREELRALFGKFKGDLKNPEFIKGVAEIMINWKSLLRSQLDEAKKKKKSKKKDPKLNKPKRGGSKAYYVYVRDPKTKKIVKVSFGSGGLRAKIKNKEARNAFAARHNCKNKKDRTSPGYWSCNLPRYADQLGLGSKMNTFW